MSRIEVAAFFCILEKDHFFIIAKFFFNKLDLGKKMIIHIILYPGQRNGKHLRYFPLLGLSINYSFNKDIKIFVTK